MVATQRQVHFKSRAVPVRNTILKWECNLRNKASALKVKPSHSQVYLVQLEHQTILKCEILTILRKVTATMQKRREACLDVEG